MSVGRERVIERGRSGVTTIFSRVDLTPQGGGDGMIWDAH